jgi:hypothetical protein
LFDLRDPKLTRNPIPSGIAEIVSDFSLLTKQLLLFFLINGNMGPKRDAIPKLI